MRVHVYPGDEGGCGSYRMIWPAQAARDQGHDVHTLLPSTDQANIKGLFYRDFNGVERVKGVLAPDCDVAVFQRPLNQTLVNLIPHLQRKGVAVVVEIDDDFHALDPQNIAWKGTRETDNPEHNRGHLLRACHLADVVTVTTPSLLDRYGFGHGVVIPNYIRETYLTIPKTYEVPLVIGWSGSLNVHPNDLQVMGAAIPSVLRAGGHDFVRFHVVGTGEGVQSKVGLPTHYDTQSPGWIDLAEYPHAMSKIDVGLVPLENSRFNQAKSWLKGLEFASLGVAFLASPTDPYWQLYDKYGIGCIVPHPKAWKAGITQVLRDAVELGEMNRRLVDINDLVIERRINEWLHAWQWALDRSVNRG